MSTRLRSALRPTPTAIAYAALGVALVGTGAAVSGPAAAVASSIVNIADPSNHALKAHVDAAGKLEVGDGAGPLTVDGNAGGLAAPANYFHAFAESSSSCQPIATPPSGKALIVRQIRVDTYDIPSPGVGQVIYFYSTANCSGAPVGDVNPGAVGVTALTFDPGVGIPAGGALSAVSYGSIEADLSIDGYAVSAGAVPATTSVTGAVTGAKGLQQRR